MVVKFKYKTVGDNGVCGAVGARGERKKLRRSITITDKNHKNLLKARAQIMTNIGADPDYTTALNMFLEIGLNRLLTLQLNLEETGIIARYLIDENLQEQSVMDLMLEIQNKKTLKQTTASYNQS